MNKIIGFTISRNFVDHNDVDVFGAGLNFLELQHGALHVCFWGIGNLESCRTGDGKYSLSFPLTASLLDRNVLVSLYGDKVIIENDWLGSLPIFYNDSAGIVSTLVNKVLPTTVMAKLDPEGFNNYLDFGYSILGQTMVSGVKFLRWSSVLKISPNQFSVQEKSDPWFEISHSDKPNSAGVLNLIKNYIQAVEKSAEGQIVIPTSGGYDSRLLNSMIEDRSRIWSFSYGVAKKPERCVEAVKAKKLSALLGTNWRQIFLKDHNRYCKKWFELYGPAVHLHGMYFMDFYGQISRMLPGPKTLLSGIIGDAWSGKVQIGDIKDFGDLNKLGYAHGLRIDPRFSLFKDNGKLRRSFFLQYGQFLNHPDYRVVMSMRFKLILLSYLTTVAEYAGMPAWSPFLQLDIVWGMLNLPAAERAARKWQVDYFRKQNILLEDYHLDFDTDVALDLEAYLRYPIPGLDVEILSSYINREKILNVNSRAKEILLPSFRQRLPFWQRLVNRLCRNEVARSILLMVGLKAKENFDAVNELTILKPIEFYLKSYESGKKA